ncbi:MAG: hypothetical protein H7831_18545, partial [Magnetococcus sp. WYHC-3]
VDGRSDLFSLGVMVYQLLAGRLPFDSDDMASLLYRITRDEPELLTRVRPELPVCAADIVHRCLHKDPAKRHQSGAELARELVACLRSLATSRPVAK